MAHVWGADDWFTALGITGGANFEIQETTNAEQSDSAIVRDKDGEFVAGSHVQHNLRTERTFRITANDPDGNTLVMTLGGNGTWCITRAAVRQTNNQHATVDITAHQHPAGDNANSAGHQADTSYEYTTPSLGFGVLAVKLGGTLADCQSAEETVEIGHRDRLDNAGNHLVGRNFGVQMSYQEEYVYQGTDPSPSGFKNPLVSVRGLNEDFKSATVTAEAYA